MEKIALFILRPFKGFITASGVNYEQLTAILRVKLMMDNRRPTALSGMQKKKNGLFIQMFVFGLMGLMAGMTILQIQDEVTAFTIVFSFIMVIIAMTMVGEFSTVLFDTTDNYILLPRPINSKTIYLAKGIHIAFYLLGIAIPLAIFPLAFTFGNYGVTAGLLFLLGVFLITLFTIFFTNILYLLLMNWLSAERLKDVISYFQIGIAIVMFGAYQLLPKIIEMEAVENATLTISWWTYLIPPVWIAGFIKSCSTLTFDFFGIVTTTLALTVPFLSIWFVTKYLAGYFTNKLSQLDVAESGEKSSASRKVKTRWDGLLTSSSEEQAAYRFAIRQTSRNRKFKISVYPALGYVLVLIIVLIKPDFKDLAGSIANLADSRSYITMLYAPLLLAFTVVQMVNYSDTPEASWIFSVVPVDKPGTIISGIVKALYVNYILPALLFCSAIVLAIWGITAAFHIIIALAMSVLFCGILVKTIGEKLPFSQSYDMQNKGNNMARNFIAIFSIVGFGLAHYGITFLPLIGQIVCFALVVVAAWLVLGSIKQISWSKIKS